MSLVDLLEIVEVQHQHSRCHPITLCALNRLLQAVIQKQAIRQSRQRIVLCLLAKLQFQLLLGLVKLRLFRDVHRKQLQRLPSSHAQLAIPMQ